MGNPLRHSGERRNPKYRNAMRRVGDHDHIGTTANLLAEVGGKVK